MNVNLFDPARAVAVLADADPQLARVIARVGPYALEPDAIQNPFESLMEVISAQQLSGKAAATIFARVKGLFGDRFPTPAELAEFPIAQLRGAGLSQAKAVAMLDLARKALGGIVPPIEELQALDDEAIMQRLTQVRGIGPWSVEMLLMFRLGRADVWPVSDYGVRKGYARMRGQAELPTPRELLAAGEPWRPYRSVAAWYLWRCLELPEGALEA